MEWVGKNGMCDGRSGKDDEEGSTWWGEFCGGMEGVGKEGEGDEGGRK